MAMPLLVTMRALGLVTKAGSFGGPQSLVRALMLSRPGATSKRAAPCDTVFFRAGRGDFDCVVACTTTRARTGEVLGLEGGST